MQEQSELVHKPELNEATTRIERQTVTFCHIGGRKMTAAVESIGA